MGNLFKPSVSMQQPQSQASPLAGDILDMIRKQIMGGTFGEGFGPLQRSAGTAIQQFVNHGSQDVMNNLYGALTDVFNTNVKQQVGDLREGMGIAGSRFGTALTRGEADLKAKADQGLSATLAQALQANQSNLLNAIQTMYGMGQSNVAPAFTLAQLGILPENLIIGNSPFQDLMQFFNTGANIAATGKAAGLF